MKLLYIANTIFALSLIVAVTGLLMLVIGKMEETNLAPLPCNATNIKVMELECSAENCNGQWCQPINCEQKVEGKCCSINGICENECQDVEKFYIKYVLNDNSTETIEVKEPIEDIKCWRDTKDQVVFVNNNPRHRKIWIIGSVFFSVGSVLVILSCFTITYIIDNGKNIISAENANRL